MESVNVWSAQISSLPGVIPIPLDPSYLRSEPNNRLSVLSSDGKQIYTILNRVAKEILDLCDGTCDLPKILRLFQEKYPDQPRETLAHDLAQTLHSLTVNCLIVWKKEGRYMNDPFGSDYLTSVNPDELLILADASRFAEIEEAAAKSLSAKQSKNGNRIYFSEFDVEPELENFLVLRQRLFSFTHDYFLLTSQSGEINGLIICEPATNPAGRSSSSNLSHAAPRCLPVCSTALRNTTDLPLPKPTARSELTRLIPPQSPNNLTIPTSALAFP